MLPTLEQYSASVVETGLMSQADIRDLVDRLPLDRRPKDPQELIRELVRQHKLTSYQAQQIYQGKGHALQLGNYVILDKIGQGGMGVVLKAEHQRMRRVVALKVIGAKSAASPAATKRFFREVEAAAKLIHPNIVTAFDAGEAEGTHFLVMEYVDGADLATLVKLDGPLSLDTAVNCVLQAARGLEYAHSKGVVHRDIKPRNLLLDREGTIKILDMGLARIETSAGGQTDLTGNGQIMGTIDYMSPEQAVSPKDADERADIYSLGVTLWYLLTGKVVYRGQNMLEKLVAHRERPVPSLAEACPSVPKELDAVFQRMVAKRAQQRYPNMTAVISDLERCRRDPNASPTVNLDLDDGSNLKEFLNGLKSASHVRRSAAAKGSSPSSILAPPKQSHGPISSDTVITGDSATDSCADLPDPPPVPLGIALAGAARSSPQPGQAIRFSGPRRKRNSALVIAGVVLVVLSIAVGAVLLALSGQLRNPGSQDSLPGGRSTARLGGGLIWTGLPEAADNSHHAARRL
jgi:serine/threonine protein kinase